MTTSGRYYFSFSLSRATNYFLRACVHGIYICVCTNSVSDEKSFRLGVQRVRVREAKPKTRSSLKKENAFEFEERKRRRPNARAKDCATCATERGVCCVGYERARERERETERNGTERNGDAGQLPEATNTRRRRTHDDDDDEHTTTTQSIIHSHLFCSWRKVC